MHPLSIQYDSAGRALALQLAAFLNVNAAEEWPLTATGLVLRVRGQSLSLCDLTRPKTKPFTLQFDQPRPGEGSAQRKDPLLRAMGKKSNTVLDLTAGWCGDAMHLVRQGYQVTALEVNKLIYSMAAHALSQINDGGLRSKISLHYACAKEFLQSQSDYYDVVYLDPMYPKNPKSAATRKDLQLLRLIAPAEFDKTVFGLAMRVANQRVVVKRPHYAPPLADGKVGETRGKLVRFDIYKPVSSRVYDG